MTSSEAGEVMRVGIDLGTRQTVLAASMNGVPVGLATDVIPTVVGFPKKAVRPADPPGRVPVEPVRPLPLLE